jgi:hypothetical protein
VPRSNRNILAASARRNMVFTFYLARASACACVHVCVRVSCRGAPVTTTVFVQSKSLSAYGEFAHPHPAHLAHRDNCLRDTSVPAEYTHRRADIVGYDIPAEAAAPFENLWCVPSPSLGVLQQPPATHPHNSPIHSLIRNASRSAAHSQFADATALSLSVCRESQGQDHVRDHQVRRRSCHKAAAKVWLCTASQLRVAASRLIIPSFSLCRARRQSPPRTASSSLSLLYHVLPPAFSDRTVRHTAPYCSGLTASTKPQTPP